MNGTQATIRRSSGIRILFNAPNMERTRPADRSKLIRVSMWLFTVLAVVCFALVSTATTWDTRTTAMARFGTTPTSIFGSARLLWPGNANFDGQVMYTGANNDCDPVPVAIGGSVPTTVVSGVYSPMDINLDGQLLYTGVGHDRDIILQTIGGKVPTAVRLQPLALSLRTSSTAHGPRPRWHFGACAGSVGSGHWWIACVCQVFSTSGATLRPSCVN
jgi:hypothetical protein